MKPILPVAGLLAVILFTACNSTAPEPAAPLTAQQQIQSGIDSFKQRCSDGDLILHLNDDIVSDVVRNMNETDKSYSHSGIIVTRNGEKFVCNITPPDNVNLLSDTIRYEPLDSFINPKYNLTAGLFRYDLTAAEKKAFLEELERYKVKNPHFDEIYNYETEDKIYCSELISKSLEKATNSRIKFKKIVLNATMVRLFLIYYRKHHLTQEYVANNPFVSIDNLYNVPQCKEIMRIKLKLMQ